MTRLIIRHGERVTEHEISDQPLVVGRDPQCDLFFADKKLSRRHARFEKQSGRVRLVDLGSRNGSWVNEERVDDVWLEPSDSIRLGALSVSLETETGESRREDEDSTVYLTADASADDSRTVVLPGAALPDAPPPEDAGTVVLPSSDHVESSPPSEAAGPSPETEDEDPTLRKPDTWAPGSRSDRTMMLEGETPRGADHDADTGTVIFRENAVPPADTTDTTTRIVTPDPAPEPAPDFETRGAELLHDASTSYADFDVAGTSRSGSLRFVALVVATAALAFAVLALPLLRTLGSTLTSESALRGRALVDLLAATNESALRENRPDQLTTARVASEPGVLGAYVLDPMGRVLAPETPGGDDPRGGAFGGLGTDVRPQDIRTLRESRNEDGTLVYVLPVRAEGRRLGLAVLHYRLPAVPSLWTLVMLGLGSLLLLMGVGAAVLMARRWTLSPVQELRDDVDALRRGIVESVVEARPYSELAAIARNFNEVARLGRSRPDEDGSETYRPNVDPTFIPDEREQTGR